MILVLLCLGSAIIGAFLVLLWLLNEIDRAVKAVFRGGE